MNIEIFHLCFESLHRHATLLCKLTPPTGWVNTFRHQLERMASILVATEHVVSVG